MREIPDPPPLLRTVAWCVGLLGLLLGLNIMVTQTVQYVQLRDDVGFLPIKQAYHHLPVWKAAFYTHVFSSIFCLLAAVTQFLPIRNRTVAAIHRWMGRLYVFAVLILACPSGGVLAWYAEGGPVGRAGFLTLTLSWFGTTLAGLLAIRRRKIDAHLAWMTRSYALTFSAVTLREWQHWLNIWLPPDIDLNPITAWLGWIPNLIVAEVWIRWRARRQRSEQRLHESHKDDRK